MMLATNVGLDEWVGCVPQAAWVIIEEIGHSNQKY